METRIREGSSPYASCSTRDPSPELVDRPWLVPCAFRRSYSFDVPVQPSADAATVTSSVTHLYTEFVQDFSKRKQARLTSKHPLENRQRYSLKVESSHALSIQTQVAELWDSPSRPQLSKRLIACLDAFVDKLAGELANLEGRSRLLRLLCLNEAYYTLWNAWREVSRVTHGLLPRYLAFERFLDCLLDQHKALVEFAKEEGGRHWVVQDFWQIYEQLPVLSVEGTVESSESDQEGPQDLLQKLPVDDLVNFINGPTKKPKKKRKRRDGSEDREVEAFKAKLEAIAPAPRRLKACISDEYLRHLRSKLI